MKKTNLLKLVMVLCVLFIAASCGDDDNNDGPIVELNVSETAVTLDDNDKGSLRVESNTSWIVEYSEQWLSCTPSQGTGTKTLTLTATANQVKSERTAIITIKDTNGKKNVTVNVTQKAGLDPLEVAPKLFLPFTDGMVTNFKYGSNVSYWYGEVFNKKDIASLSDDQIIGNMTAKAYNKYEREDLLLLGVYGTSFTPNTEFVLCTVGYDQSGKQGKLAKIYFKTKAANLPRVEIASVTASTYSGTPIWDVKVSHKNDAIGFYGGCSENAGMINMDDHFVAYHVYKDHEENPQTMTTKTNPIYDRHSQQVVVCTWGVDASWNIGDYCVARVGGKASAMPKKQQHYNQSSMVIRSFINK